MELVIDLHSSRTLEYYIGISATTNGVRDILLDFRACDHAKIENLIVIVALVRRVRRSNPKLKVSYVQPLNPNIARYISRVDFLTHCGVPQYENFMRHDVQGRMLEISCFDIDSIDSIGDSLMRIVAQMEVPRSIQEILNFCLWELTDNVNRHALSTGIVGAQFYRNKGELIIVIADNGRGIQNSLKANPSGKYAEISNAEAVASSVDLGVSSTDRGGNGLFLSAEIANLNGGHLHLFSGTHMICCKNNRKLLLETPDWQGVIVVLKLNTRNSGVDYKEVFIKNSLTQGEGLELNLDLILNGNEHLW